MRGIACVRLPATNHRQNTTNACQRVCPEQKLDSISSCAAMSFFFVFGARARVERLQCARARARESQRIWCECLIMDSKIRRNKPQHIGHWNDGFRSFVRPAMLSGYSVCALYGPLCIIRFAKMLLLISVKVPTVGL